MIRSLYTSLTGLSQNQNAMDVVGDNLSNINTTGYKANRIVFQDLFNQTLSGAMPPTGDRGGTNPKQIGMGADLGAIDSVFTQGALQDTGVVTDMAVQGNGFFTLQDQNGELSYTRAGNFYFDRDGNLVNSDGLYVMGYMPDADGEFYPDMAIEPIQIGEEYMTIPARATSEVNISGNLDTDATGSVMEFDHFLTSAGEDESVFNLHGANGEGLGLNEGEEIVVKANANENTRVENLYSVNDENLSLTAENPITFSGRVVTNSGNVSEFSFEVQGETLGDIASELEDQLNDLIDSPYIPGALDPNGSNFDVSVNEEGQIVIERGNDGLIAGIPSTNRTVEIDNVAGTSALQSTFGNLLGSYREGTTRASDTIKFEKVLFASSEPGVNQFDDLETLSSLIQNAVQDNLSEDFESYYDESTGQIKYYNPENNIPPLSDVTLNTDDIYGFEITKTLGGGSFNETVNPDSQDILADDGNRDDAMASKTFSSEITEDTTLDKLLNAKGENLGLVNPETGEGTVVYFDAKIDGKSINPEASNLFDTVNAPSDEGGLVENIINNLPSIPPISWFQTVDENGNPKTVGDLVNAINSYLGDNAADVTLEDGAIVVKGNPGKANEITSFDIGALNAPKFSELMDQYKYLQHADGGLLTTSQTLYDSQGNEHSVNYNFEMVDNNTWRLRLSTPEGSGDQAVFNAQAPYVNDELYIDFNPDGSIARTYYVTPPYGEQSIVDNPGFTLLTSNGTDNITVSDFNINDIVLTSENSNIDRLQQNGYTMGTIQEIVADDMGTLIGNYDNGIQRNLARVTLATFTNNNGLESIGGTLFQQTANSGVPSFGFSGEGGRGAVRSGYLEDSNVDMAKEFVNMIIAQRGFQANSRAITTADEMIQEVLGLKR